MVEIVVDGERHEVPAGGNLLQSLLSLGLDLPYFCWHPALGSVGACRQCAVVQYRDENDVTGRLAMACMTPVAEGLRIGLKAPAAVDFRAGIIELLMTNHPHDCPVCEEGGECHLQDMTVMTGHTFRQYRGLKRTHRNQDLGPFINHEMNRCIACYRCVRFYRDYAGGDDLQVFASRNQVYFGRFEDGALENEFSGNLVEVCPTGVFTDKTFSAHYTRKWDLQTAPSVCVHCGVGCNTTPGERYGVLKRVINRYNGEVNGYFLCDRGRFGYGFVNAADRLAEPMVHGQPVTPAEGIATLREWALDGAIGIGSPRASLEANFALRELVGAENFYAGCTDGEYLMLGAMRRVLASWPVRSPSVREVERADVVLVLGEDVANSAPRLALAIRQATRNRALADAAALKIAPWQDAAVRELAQEARSPLFVLAASGTGLDELAEILVRRTPADIARLGFAIAHALEPAAPPVSGLVDEDRQYAAAIATALQQASNPLVVSGTGCGEPAVVEAAAQIAGALARNRKQPASVSFVVPECNSLGLMLLDPKRLSKALEAAESGLVPAAIVLENDLFRRARLETVKSFLSRVPETVVIDHSPQATAHRARMVLPGTTFAETEGTFVSAEGRAQRFFAVMSPRGAAMDSWRWLAAAQPRHDWQCLDEVTRACAAAFPALAAIIDVAPAAGFRIDGLKIPRQTHRRSGRTAATAHIDIHEPQPQADADSALAFSMEGDAYDAPAALRPYSWAPGWNSNGQSIAKFQDEVGGALRGCDPGLRLFEPRLAAKVEWFQRIPEPAPALPGLWLAVPLHHVFGSEELSARAEPVAERSPAPYVKLNPADVARLGHADSVELDWHGCREVLPVLEDDRIGPGTVGIPVGLPGMPSGPCPRTLALRKAEPHGSGGLA